MERPQSAPGAKRRLPGLDGAGIPGLPSEADAAGALDQPAGPSDAAQASCFASPLRRPPALVPPDGPALQEHSSPGTASSMGTPSPARFRRRDLLPPMLSTLGLHLQGPFHGSSTLPAMDAVEPPRAPGTVYSKRQRHTSFEAAKLQVDRELRGFRREAAAALALERAGGLPGEQGPIQGLLDIAARCIAEDSAAFKASIQALVDLVEARRRACTVPAHKALATSLLFILTRCSRLLPSEQGEGGEPQGPLPAHVYGTLPRGALSQRWRRPGGAPPSMLRRPGRGPGVGVGGSPRSPASRSLTLPSRALRDAVTGFQRLRLQGRELGPLAESPAGETGSTPGSLAGAVPGTAGAASHLGRSPLGRNVVTALEAALDQVARPGSGDTASTPPATPSRAQGPGSGKSGRDTGLVASLKRLHKRLSGGQDVRLPLGEDSVSGSGTPPSCPGSPASPATPSRQPAVPGTLPRPRRLRVTSYPALPGTPLLAGGQAAAALAQARVGPGSEASASTVSPRAAEAASSPERSPHRARAVSLVSQRSLEHVVCRICEEPVLGELVGEHSALCSAVAERCSEEQGLDAYLTRLADCVEQQLGQALAGGEAEARLEDAEDMGSIIACLRAAAALQPDSTADPARKCQETLDHLEALVAGAGETYPRLSVDVELFVARARRSIAAKVEELCSYLPRRGPEEEGTPPTAGPASAAFGALSIDDFTLLKPISRGSFGRVYLCQKNATKDLYAIKVMRKAELRRKNMVDNVRNERNILALTDNPFVVAFYYSFTNDANLYIVMEYCSGGDCASLLKGLGCMEEGVAQLYIAETILALEYCHTKGIIHRDLKPENLLIGCDGHIKLTDFGLSTIGIRESSNTAMVDAAAAMDTDSNASTPRSMSFSAASSPPRGTLGQAALPDARPGSADGRRLPRGPAAGRRSETGLDQAVARLVASEAESRRAVGTPDYLAPELLLGSRHGHEVDWWSLGAILYEFVTGSPPFAADTPRAIFDNILDRRLAWPEDPECCVSPACRDLVERLLEPDPELRLGHRGAGEVKLHPFFQADAAEGRAGINWRELVTQKAAFVPSSESKLLPSLYFEEKPFSKRSMELDVRSERRSLVSPSGSSRSRRRSLGSSRSRPAASGLASPASTDERPQSAGPSVMSLASASERWPEGASAAATEAAPASAGSRTGSSGALSGGEAAAGGSGSGGSASGSSAGGGDSPDGAFLDWSFKNVELLNERNREMAEQLAERRSETGERGG